MVKSLQWNLTNVVLSPIILINITHMGVDLVHMPQALLIGAILIVFVLLTSALGSVLISYVGIRYAEKRNAEHLNAVVNLLPQTDCKDCGCETCRQFADCLLSKEVTLDRCPHCRGEAKEPICQTVADANPESRELPTNLRQRKKLLRLRKSEDEDEE